MKSKKLQDAIGMIDEDLVARADMPKNKGRTRSTVLKWTAPIAAALAIVAVVLIIIFP